MSDKAKPYEMSGGKAPITIIASLLHLPCIETVAAFKRHIAAGGNVVDEDTIKPVVLQLREAFDQLRAELAAAEGLVDALNAQRGLDAAAAMRVTAEAREEQREACAAQFDDLSSAYYSHENAAKVRATPLDATPLADRIAELEANAEFLGAADVGALVAERDALKAQVERLTAAAKGASALVESLREGVEDMHWYSARDAMNSALLMLGEALKETKP